jgi:hypothetical protein
VSSLTRPRGPLPRRVYWVRRLMVLGTAVLLVVALGRILTSGSDASDPAASDRARRAAAEPSSGPTAEETTKKRKTKKRGGQGRASETAPPTPVLAQPTGPCANEEILANPVVTEAIGGSDVMIAVELRTQVTAACTWTVSPESLTLKITSGDDDIWSSRECPRAVPTRHLVVRQAVATKVGVRWNAKRSDDVCSTATDWARPGWYHVVAAALAGEPTDVQFELLRPERPVVTRTVSPSPDPRDDRKKDRKKNRG